MYCKYCGNEIKDDSKFCTYCGKSSAVENDSDNIQKPVNVLKHFFVFYEIVALLLDIDTSSRGYNDLIASQFLFKLVIFNLLIPYSLYFICKVIIPMFRK